MMWYIILRSLDENTASGSTVHLMLLWLQLSTRCQCRWSFEPFLGFGFPSPHLSLQVNGKFSYGRVKVSAARGRFLKFYFLSLRFSPQLLFQFTVWKSTARNWKSAFLIQHSQHDWKTDFVYLSVTQWRHLVASEHTSPAGRCCGWGWLGHYCSALCDCAAEV